MPYIPGNRRKDIAMGDSPKTLGELTYVLYITCLDYVQARPPYSYELLGATIGAIDCAKLELYRRLLAAYEDTKIRENGDI